MGATITFEAVAEDLLEDGSEVNKLLRGVVDGICRVLLQKGLHREPGERWASQLGGDAPSTRLPALAHTRIQHQSKALFQLLAPTPGSGKRASGWAVAQ